MIEIIITTVLASVFCVVAVLSIKARRKTKRMLEEYEDRVVLFNNEDLEQLMQLNSRSQPLLSQLWLDDETHEELLERSLVEHADIWKKMADR